MEYGKRCKSKAAEGNGELVHERTGGPVVHALTGGVRVGERLKVWRSKKRFVRVANARAVRASTLRDCDGLRLHVARAEVEDVARLHSKLVEVARGTARAAAADVRLEDA